MLASEIVTHARSLSDLPNTDFISHDDEKQALNESYRDVYSKLTDSDDDYFYTEVVIPVLSSYAVAGTFEMLLPLPVDCYKIRRVDYMSQNIWLPVDRFSMSQRNSNPSAPMYRLQNGKLWIIGGGMLNPGVSIKVGYYPPPATVTVPQDPIKLGSSYSPYLWGTISAPFYYSYPQANGDNHRVAYYTNGTTTVVAQDYDANTTTTVYTGTGVASPQVIGGYLYILEGSIVKRGPVSSTGLITMSALPTTITTATWMEIADNKIYYTVGGGQTYSANLDGSSPVQVYATAIKSVCACYGFVYAYTIANKALRSWTLYPAITDGLSITSDNQYLYTLDIGYPYAIDQYNVDPTTGDVSNVKIVSTGYSNLGNATSEYMGVTSRDTLQPLLVGSDPDFDFYYPLNFLPELLAYQCAIDFTRKQKMDPSLLEVRLAKKWEEFFTVIRRDDINVGRIQNHYVSSFNWGR